jgi:hypothetical protein
MQNETWRSSEATLSTQQSTQLINLFTSLGWLTSNFIEISYPLILFFFSVIIFLSTNFLDQTHPFTEGKQTTHCACTVLLSCTGLLHRAALH